MKIDTTVNEVNVVQFLITKIEYTFAHLDAHVSNPRATFFLYPPTICSANPSKLAVLLTISTFYRVRHFLIVATHSPPLSVHSPLSATFHPTTPHFFPPNIFCFHPLHHIIPLPILIFQLSLIFSSIFPPEVFPIL